MIEKNDLVTLHLDETSRENLLLQRGKYRGKSDSEIAFHYTARIREVAGILRSHLPDRKNRQDFLDIGCGLGFGILVLREIYGPDNHFVALDRDARDAVVKFGFKDVAEAYNDLSNTRSFLEANGIAPKDLTTIDIDRTPFPDGSFDVVSSHLAWGWHFPVEAYLDRVKAATKPGSFIYIDLRSETSGFDVMSKHFTLLWSADNTKGKHTLWRA